jgi:hypothetical protein
MSARSEEGDGLDAGASVVIAPTEGGLKPVRLARLATAHCASRCATASAAAFSAAVMWHDFFLAMTELQLHGVRRDTRRRARPVTRVTSLALANILSTGIDSPSRPAPTDHLGWSAQ